MDERKRFKIAVLALCADHGLSLSESLTLVKQANAALMEKRGAPVDWARGATKTILTPAKWLFLAGLIGPPILGAMGGYGLAKATAGINEQTPEELKHQEMVEELRRQTEHAKAQMAVSQRRRQQATGGGRRLGLI